MSRKEEERHVEDGGAKIQNYSVGSLWCGYVMTLASRKDSDMKKAEERSPKSDGKDKRSDLVSISKNRHVAEVPSLADDTSHVRTKNVVLRDLRLEPMATMT